MDCTWPVQVGESDVDVRGVQLALERLRGVEGEKTRRVGAVGDVLVAGAVGVVEAFAVVENVDGVEVMQAEVFGNGSKDGVEVCCNVAFDAGSRVLNLGGDIVDK